MAGDSGSPSLLILLVGTNPLPDYLVACALRPTKIALIHSPETQLMSERLQKCLAKARDPTPDFELVCIADAVKASDIWREVSRLVSGHNGTWQVLLNYTGGTKVMAAHALRAFYESGGSSANASYLDDGGPGASPALWFDDGTTRTLAEFAVPPLRLETLLELHGWLTLGHSSQQALRVELNDLARSVLAEPAGARLLREEPHRFGLHPPSSRDEQLFLDGLWLEHWIADRIKATDMVPPIEENIVRDLRVQRHRDQPGPQVDIALARNYRTYLLSCTTSSDKGRCKQKLFEIAVRARQLAGDLARPALACLAGGHTLGQLRDEVEDETAGGGALQVPGLGRVHVFGLEDLRAWAGWGGAPPNLKSLRDWLES